ncbi:uncharacterized protein LOC124925134 [Impatiens glandulifera]|uniref:uncharacterized protein LOC124925134 n=1 Tax=Impatiens glandulifera TaxID=253017 RepID=UPI001FB07749|nr:uncharacterized protein LOC124925134 [Impatiens glandulifera]
MDCKPQVLVRCNAVMKNESKVINLKDIVDTAINESTQNGITVDTCLALEKPFSYEKVYCRLWVDYWSQLCDLQALLNGATVVIYEGLIIPDNLMTDLILFSWAEFQSSCLPLDS